MGKYLTVLFSLFISADPSFAVVEVYLRQPIIHKNSCVNFFGLNFDYIKSPRGIRRSLGGHDPVDGPAQYLSKQSFVEHVTSGLQTVHQAYIETFRRKGWKEEKIKEQIKSFEAEDADGLNRNRKNEESIYFISRGKDGAVAVLRAILVKEPGDSHLPIESKVTLDQVNRVELGRAFNAPGTGAEIIIREILQEAGIAFQQHFENNPYQIFALTDAARARHYKSWGFDRRQVDEVKNPHENYLVFQSGADFNYRYSGHIQKAYQIAFGSYPLQPQKALDLLKDMASQNGMNDYIPNLVAQSALEAFMGRYAEALKISNHLMQIGNAEVNLDFNFLWQSRLAYDPFARTGDINKAIELVMRPLEKKPLETSSYNDRAAIFIIYELKLLLATERFDQVKALIELHRPFLRMTMQKKRAQFSHLWSYLSLFPRDKSMYSSHLERLRLAWDLNTNADGISIAVLAPETYRMAARLYKAMGDETASEHYKRVSRWLQITLGSDSL